MPMTVWELCEALLDYADDVTVTCSDEEGYEFGCFELVDRDGRPHLALEEA